MRCGDVLPIKAKDGTCFSCRGATAPSAVPPIRKRSQQEVDDDRLLPSAHDIAVSRSRVMEFIPDYMLRAVTEAVNIALLDIAANAKDLSAWNRFGMLWKTLLRTRRSGKTKKKRMREKRIEDLERWEKGELSALWRDAQAQVPGRRAEQEAPIFEDLERACVAEARKGRPAAAFSRLSSSGLAPDSEATLQALRAKHPPPPSKVELGPALVKPATPDDLTPAQVLALVKRMPRGTAAGPSGLRADHLKQMLNESDVNILPALTHVLNAVRAARVPDEVTPFLAGARLMALPKGANDVRPIAVGETLRRLAAKSYAADVKKQAKDILLPGKQVGVGVEGGIEAATETVRDFAFRHIGQDKVVLKIDFSNAFNTVCRNTLLNQTRAHLPKLSRFVEWCYVYPSSLVYGEVVVQSQSGVQQGDPLGPLLFSLVVKGLTETVRDLPGVDLSVWYLDDGTLMGSPAAVAKAFEVLKSESLKLGLSVNSSKCELIPLGGEKNHTDAVLQDAGFAVADLKVLREGFSFLGAPIGTNEYCDEFMESTMLEFSKKLRLLGKLGDAQVALSLLRHCEGFCKTVFYMRALRHQGDHKWLDKYDKEVDRVLAQILSSPGSDPDALMPDAARVQAALPVRIGGLGVRRAYDHWTAAAMGAASGTFDLCKHLDKHYRWDAGGWSHTATRYNELVDADARVNPEEQPQQILKQRDLSAPIITRQVSELRDTGDIQDRARLNSLQLPLAGAWITALPTPENVINPEEFRAVVRLRLGLAVHRDKALCEQCGRPMDEFGIHALNCSHGGCTIRRHDRLRDLVGMLGSKAGLAPSLEPKHIVLGGTKPADIFFSIGVGDGKPRAVDCVVANPLAKSHVQGAARAVGHAAVTHQTAKRGKHGEACRKAHISFTAFAAEVLGGLGPEADTLWRHLNKMAAERADGDKVLASVKWNERLAVCVQREVGATLLKRGALCFSLAVTRTAVPAKAVSLDKSYYVSPDPPDDRFPSYVDDHLYRLSENDCEVEEEPVAPVAPDPLYDVDEATAAMEAWLSRQAGKESTHPSTLEVPSTPCEDPATAFKALETCDPPPALPLQLSSLGCSVPADFRYTVGDCCFDAVAYQCGRSAGSLRQAAIAQVVQDEDLAARAEPSVGVWARQMSIAGCARPDTWADMVTVSGLARALHSLVVVFIGGHRPSVFTPSGEVGYRRVLALAHDGRTAGHFTPVNIPEKLTQFLLMHEPTPRLPPLTCVSREGLLDCPLEDSRADFGKCELCSAAVLGRERHWECRECSVWVCVPCRSLPSTCPWALPVSSKPCAARIIARAHEMIDPKSINLVKVQREARVTSQVETAKARRAQTQRNMRQASSDVQGQESGYSTTHSALPTPVASSVPPVAQAVARPGASAQSHPGSDGATQPQTGTESGFSNTHSALPVSSSSEAVPSSVHPREQPPAASQGSEFSMDLIDESELAVPMSDATSAPSTYTQSESGSQPAPTALPTNVPFYAGMAPCPGFNNMGCPATAEAWKDTFYPNTLQHQSLAAGGDWQSVDDALTCLYLWKEAKKPSMSSDEVEEAYTLYNRLRGLKRSRNSRPSQST